MSGAALERSADVRPQDPEAARQGEAIGASFFVFRRGNTSQRYCVPMWPFEYPNRAAAIAEASQLAQEYPGEVFEVFERIAASFVERPDPVEATP